MAFLCSIYGAISPSRKVIDLPTQKDSLGDALIGGDVTGIVTRATAAVARALVTGAAASAVIQRGKEAMRCNERRP